MFVANQLITNRLLNRIGITGCVFSAVTICPLIIWTYFFGDQNVASSLYQIQWACIFVCLTVVSWQFLQESDRSKRIQVCILVFTFLIIASQINVYSVRSSWDYAQIETACSAILHGESPYKTGTEYVLYPPFYAAVMASIFKLIEVTLLSSHIDANSQKIFSLVFYLFQNLQLYACWLLVILLVKFIKSARFLNDINSALMSCAVVLISAPIAGTLKMHQVNVFICDALLLGFLLSERFAPLKGISLALGIHLKVYPAVVFLPMVKRKQWKSIAWTAVLSIAIAALLTNCLGADIWNQYLRTSTSYIASLPLNQPAWLFAAPSPFTFLNSICRLFSITVAPEFLTKTSRLLVLAIDGWLAFRIARRFRNELNMYTLYDDLTDVLTIALISGPSVLYHHYVLAIPISIWTTLRVCPKYLIVAVIAAALTICDYSSEMAEFGIPFIALVTLAFLRTLSEHTAMALSPAGD